jgi:hypothetical protein
MNIKSRFLVLAIGGAAASVALWPSRAQAQEAPRVGVPTRAIVGGSLLVGTYIPSFIVAAESGRDGDKALYAPVVGPWIDLGVRGGCGPVSCGTEGLYKTLLVADGVAQGVGLITALLPGERGFFMIGNTRVTPTRVGRDGYGVGAVGQF